MTVSQRNNIKSLLPIGISTATLFAILGLGYNTGEIKTELRKDIDKNTENILIHSSDATLHMPFDRKIEVFVPRVELDGRLRNIEKYQEENKKTQERILNILLKN